MEKINVWNLFKLAWSDFKKSWLFFVVSFIVFAIIGFVDGMFGFHEVAEGVYKGSILLSIIIQILTIYLGAGLILETLKIVDGVKPYVKNMFIWPSNFIHLLKYFGGYILYTMLIIIPTFIGMYIFLKSGSLLPIIPGLLFTLVVAFYIGFAYYLLAENRYGILENISKSFSMTNKNAWVIIKWYLYIFLITLVIFIIFSTILGVVSFVGLDESIIGMIIALIIVPMFVLIGGWVGLAFNHLYRQIDPEVQKIEE